MRLTFVFYRVSQLYETGNFSYTLPTHRATVYLIGVAVRFLIRETKPSLSLNKVITVKLFFREHITTDARNANSTINMMQRHKHSFLCVIPIARRFCDLV
jgi:hypothetical protein